MVQKSQTTTWDVCKSGDFNYRISEPSTVCLFHAIQGSTFPFLSGTLVIVWKTIFCWGHARQRAHLCGTDGTSVQSRASWAARRQRIYLSEIYPMDHQKSWKEIDFPNHCFWLSMLKFRGCSLFPENICIYRSCTTLFGKNDCRLIIEYRSTMRIPVNPSVWWDRVAVFSLFMWNRKEVWQFLMQMMYDVW